MKRAARILAWIGRQRTRAVAALVLIGIALPPLGALLKPYVTEAVVGLLCIAFLRIDGRAFRAYFAKPGLVVAATAWSALAVPALFASGASLLGTAEASPPVYLGLMLQGIASPMMAAPAFAALMGLDATLVLTALVVGTALVPLTAPVFAYAIDLPLSLSPLALGVKLLAILAGSAAAGLALRRLVGPPAIGRWRDEIDGVNILLLLVFVAAVMGNVGVRFLAAPLQMLGLTALAFAVFLLLLGSTYLAFARMGSRRALAIAMMASQRNMGLMLAATGGILPDLTWLYFAVGQFPIYLSPALLAPLVRRLARDDP